MKFNFKPKPCLSDQIAAKIKGEIAAGRFDPDHALPSSRELSSFYKINKNTIVKAYKKLHKLKWIYTKNRSGYYVNRDWVKITDISLEEVMSEILSQGYSANLETSESHRESTNDEKPKFLLAEPDSFDNEPLYRRYTQSFKAHTEHQSWYNPLGVSSSLSYAVNRIIWKRGINHKPSEICLMEGGNNLIYAILRASIKKGDAVAVFMPGNIAICRTISFFGATVIPVNGLSENLLKDVAATVTTYNIKLLIVESDCHFPTCKTLSKNNELALQALAIHKNFLILEINYNHEFVYGEDEWHPIIYYSQSNTIHLACVSRITNLLQSLKYVIGPEEIIERIKHYWEFTGFFDPLQYKIKEDLIFSGALEEESKKFCKELKMKNLYLTSSLREQLDDSLSFEAPVAGSGLWINVPGEFSISEQFLLLKKSGIQITDPDLYANPEINPGGFHLSFSSLRKSQIPEVCETLARLTAFESTLIQN